MHIEPALLRAAEVALPAPQREYTRVDVRDMIAERLRGLEPVPTVTTDALARVAVYAGFVDREL